MFDLMLLSRMKKHMFHDIIECLVAALEAKDEYTSGHSTRVGDMAFDLAKNIGLRSNECEKIHIAAHLHDIGKIGVSENVLNKKGKLLPHEWTQIKRHPQIGFEILNKSKKLKDIAEIVLCHHERWDGKGYPNNLQGLNIPLGSRIIAICDTIDAMMSIRPYRASFSIEETRQEIIANKAIQFDPKLVDATENLWPAWERLIKKSYNKNKLFLPYKVRTN